MIILLQVLLITKNFTVNPAEDGIRQDIVCLKSSNLFRGISWEYVPTTLLSQCDSCIGSKSSINLSSFKNVLGTFNPPKKIIIFYDFLKTLKKFEINSGIGEILKFHIIKSYSSFRKIENKISFNNININDLKKLIMKTLKIKKTYIEIDEFDENIRRLFNYGHTFGHAIETASNYKIPHGIAISMGMFMANSYSSSINELDTKKINRINIILKKNFSNFRNKNIDFKKFKNSLIKDKKNIEGKVTLILPKNFEFNIYKTQIIPTQTFWKACKKILSNIKK